MDPELKSQLMGDAQRAVDDFVKADKNYRDTLAEIETELPEAFEELWSLLEKRNVSCIDARKKVKAARAKMAPFRTQSRQSVIYDPNGFIQMAREAGQYEDLCDAGIIKTAIDASKLKDHVDAATMVKYKEGCATVVETGAAVYGPKELSGLK
jgi:hypothetical protein